MQCHIHVALEVGELPAGRAVLPGSVQRLAPRRDTVRARNGRRRGIGAGSLPTSDDQLIERLLRLSRFLDSVRDDAAPYTTTWPTSSKSKLLVACVAPNAVLAAASDLAT